MIAVRPIPSSRRRRTDIRSATPCVETGDMASAAITDTALPQFDVRALARRAAVPAIVAAIAAGLLIAAGGPAQAFAEALRRAVDADPRWVAAGAGFEVLSFAGYVALLWLVAAGRTRGSACARASR